MIVAEGSHWVRAEGNQVVAASKVGQKAQKDLRMGGARRGSRSSVGVREKSVRIAVHAESGNLPTTARKKAEEQMWWIEEALPA